METVSGQLKTATGDVPIHVQCCVCQRQRTSKGWRHRPENSGVVYSHAYCPACFSDSMAKLKSMIVAGRGFARVTAAILCLATTQLLAQVGNDVTAVSPDSAAPGTSGLTVTFTLDSDMPPPPPAGVVPNSVTIGTLVGTAVAHPSQYTVTADFDIPAGEAAGVKDVAVTFTTPQGRITFSKAGGFTVTVGANTPPSFTQNPESGIVQPGEAVTLTAVAMGTDPLYYQWMLDGSPIGGATSNGYTIASASNSDEGDYTCFCSNAYGTATSSAATLTVTDVLPYPGYNLFSSLQDTNAYLMDNFGTVVKTWSSSYRNGHSMYLLDDGSLLRTANTGSTVFDGGGAGGRLEEYDWDGNLTWAFDYDTTAHRSHHDVEVLPNGNIVMIAWEMKTQTEAEDAGRNPALLSDGELWPDTIVEVAPTGTYGGTIVWEWHVWDHLVQDYSAIKANYGVVADNPQLVDVNYVMSGPTGGNADWNHINSIDYNEELDQIMVSVRNFSEIWVIDHNTTTAEAAGHSGGNSGKGGDLLYRWGNPQTHDSSGDQQLFVQHDAKWIEDGVPGAGNILVFNNGQGRSGGDYSSVDEIVPPVDGNGAYASGLPAAATWTYVASMPTNFYASHISGAQRLPNGSTLICEGTSGEIFEVSTNSETVWHYEVGGTAFRFERYPWTYSGFDGRGLDPSEPIVRPYTIVDTAQEVFYDNDNEISTPGTNSPFYGQDAQYEGNQPAYVRSADGKTVYDYHTGLTWTQTADLNGDGLINIDDKMARTAAEAYVTTLNAASYGGYNDWRLPSIKEVYSLMDFRGTDPMSDDTSTLVPFINSNFFGFGFGDLDAGERTIDSQLATTSVHLDPIMGGGTAFSGLNIVDGRIKGYPASKDFYVYYCRGNTNYGVNAFVANGDGTVTDEATGLMWSQDDSGSGMLWSNALAYVKQLNAANHLGYSDWRLPNAKEMQSIVDYSRSPGTGSAAIDPIINCTTISNEGGQTDWPWYFTGTTHRKQNGSGSHAVYVCFGRATGYWQNNWTDVHGSGAQRSDSKVMDTTGYTYVTDGWYFTNAPQGDAARWYNFVRVVRDVGEPVDSDGDGLTDDEEVNTYGSDPFNADSDDDGMEDGDEVIAGTGLTDPNSLLYIDSVSVNGTTATVAWPSVNDRDYTLYGSTNLLSTNWTAVSTHGATAPTNTSSATVTSDKYFFRLTARKGSSN